MRKGLVALLSLILIFSVMLTACGGKVEDTGRLPFANDPVNGNGAIPNQEAQTQLGFIKASDPSKIPANSLKRTDLAIFGMDAQAGVFNPFFVNTSYDGFVVDLVFERLANISQDASIVPDLAIWETSEDGKIWTFQIDPNAKFSDGMPVTAEDAEFSFYITLDPTYDGRTNMSIPKIVGAEEYRNGNATTIEGIKVLDDKTLQITVDEANALTINYLATWVVPKHYYGEGFSKGNLSGVHAKIGEPMGSGPYKFVSFTPGQEVRFVANEDYWRADETPKIKNIIYKSTTNETHLQMLEVGETDFEEGISANKDNVEMLQMMGFLDVSLLLNNGYGYIGLNHTNPKFQDKRVRQALTYGLDRDSIVFAYSQGYANVIDVPQSKLSWAYPDESKLTTYNFDLEKAAQLLDEAGWVMAEDGFRYKDGEKFIIHFSATSPSEVNEALIPIAIENYRDLGIEFIAEQLEFNAVLQKVMNQEHEMAFLATTLGFDPDPFGLFHTNGGSNFDKYSNPELDALIEAGQKEMYQEKRKEIYDKVYQIINDDMPVIFMYQRYNMNTINSRLQGFDITPYFDFTETIHHVNLAK